MIRGWTFIPTLLNHVPFRSVEVSSQCLLTLWCSLGMERLQKSMSAYVKWLGRRGEAFEDKEKGLPVSYMGRTMVSHGEDFEPDSDFGNGLIAVGRANERISAVQETFVSDGTTLWLESLERSLAMMKEYQVCRRVECAASSDRWTPC